MSHGPHHAPPSPPELAARWQALGQEWAHWYARAASGMPGGSTGRADTEFKSPAAIAPEAFDPQKLALLNAKYQARWEALWSAAMAAFASGAQGQGPIPDVAHAAHGDRRFTAREWRELPYFVLLKQGYLLFGEYLNELATLATLPEQDKRRLAFLTKQ